MMDIQMDAGADLMLDGNAVAGLLEEVFGREMTAVTGECAGCGQRAELGAVHAYTRGPGIVLRCPSCEAVLMRIVVTDRRVYVESRGLQSMQLQREG